MKRGVDERMTLDLVVVDRSNDLDSMLSSLDQNVECCEEREWETAPPSPSLSL